MNRLYHRRTRLFLTTIALLITALATITGARSFAQQTTGTIQGNVTDQTGASVPQAQIELINEGTNISVRQITDEDGNYIFNLVPPGSYTIKATKPGFNELIKRGVTIEVNKNNRIDLPLTVGDVTVQVEVTADTATRIDTVSPQVSTNIGTKFITDLPSADRNVLDFAEQAPGVDIANPSTGSQVMNIEGSYATVNGNRRGANSFYLDGSDNRGSFRNGALQFPNPDAIEQVQVATNSTSARYGKQSGGSFNVVSKSGTNEFHGTAFYFFRNKNLNANTWGRNRAGEARPEAKLNQIGGTIGGPVYLPRFGEGNPAIYDGRNKTFFFASFMRYRDEQQGFQNTALFPTAAMLGGDFSEFPGQLYSPDHGANGNENTPLDGNRIPQNLLNPVALRLARLLPQSNRYLDRYIWNFVSPFKNHEVLAKIDHNFNSAHRLTVSYFRTWGNATFPGTDGAGNQVPGFGAQLNTNRQTNLAIRHNWIIASNLIAEARFTYARHAADRDHTGRGQSLADFGALWPLIQAGGGIHLPQLTVTSNFNTRRGFLSYFNQPNQNLGATVTWTKGKHNLVFGGEYQRDQVAQFNDTAAGGALTFDGTTSSFRDSQGRTNTGSLTYGYALADFLMGQASNVNAAGVRDYDLSARSFFFFLEDQWRVTPKLTLTPALRYELFPPANEVRDRTSAFVLNHKSSQYANAPQHLAFIGDQGISGDFVRTDKNNFSPRFGFAYDLFGNGRTALRGGAGIYYAHVYIQIKMWNAEQPPWQPSLSLNRTTSTAINLSNPFNVTNTNPLLVADPNRYNYGTGRLPNIVGYDPAFRTPSTAQWNLTLAHQLRNNVTIEAGYVGNRGFNLIQAVPFNVPVYSAAANAGNIDARRPLSGYQSVSLMSSRARSWYDSLQLSSNMRLGRGLTARVTYVFQKSFSINDGDPTGTAPQTANPLNLDGEKAEDAAHHRFRAFYVYDLPFFAGSKGFLRAALGGWQLSGTVAASSGSPVNVTLGEDWNFDGLAGDRPNLIAPIVYTSGDLEAAGGRYFDTGAFARPAERGVFGTLGRNALRGPGNWNTTFALIKNIQFSESKRFQLRGETYNLFNHPNLNNPITALNSVDFGRITGRNGNRTVQIGLKFYF